MNDAKKQVIAALLADDKRRPLTLNPVDSPKLSRSEKKLALAQALRKRRGDSLYALLTMAGADSPMGQSR